MSRLPITPRTFSHLSVLLFLLVVAPLTVNAQFGHFFENMFSGGGGGGQHHGGHGGNMASDSRWYRGNYDKAPCNKYLCPGTLACVDKPTHCPCAWPDVEEKFELHPDGLAVCLSKSAPGGSTGVGKTARKMELARKGLI